MDKTKLKEVLEKHLHWIKGDCDGWKNMRANLTRADLTGANLTRADLTGADLTGAKIEKKLIDKFFPICCPEHGAFIGYKKANGYIVKLQICEDAM